MIPTQVPEPFHRDGWVYEEKVDGWRILAYKDGARARLLSRTGVDHAKRFREVAAAVASLAPATLVLDGELAIFDEQLRSRFDWLRRGATADALATPVFIAFDLLYRGGKDETDRPLRDRRVLLEDAIAGTSGMVLPARRLAANGLDAWAQVLGSGYEGYVAKDEASPYRGGIHAVVAQGEGSGMDRPGRSVAPSAHGAMRRRRGGSINPLDYCNPTGYNGQ
jgi:bifunctional non-homologous end joining protein LigD